MVQADSLAEFIALRLRLAGVRRIFGVPGGGSSLALIKAAASRGIDFVLARSETAATLMAAVTGELTGVPGVALTGIGPGAASAVNGIAYAHLERAPLLLFTDGPAASLHQAFDQNALFAPITKRQGRLRPGDGGRTLEDALHAALSPPWGPVQLDLTAADAGSAGPGRLKARPPGSRGGPDAQAMDKARALLAASRRPILIAGLEARYGRAPVALRALAEGLYCPVLQSYKAKGVLSESGPHSVGLFTGAAGEAVCLRGADLLVFYGFDPVEMVPADWPHGMRMPVLDVRRAAAPELSGGADCRLIGDLGAIGEALREGLRASRWSLGDLADLRRTMDDLLSLEGAGHTAQSVVTALYAAAPQGCRLAVDAGAHMFSALSCWRAGAPFGVLKSNGLSTMGYALPAAIASALEAPSRPVLAVIGDGGMMMCLSELATALERNCRIVVVVLNDAALSLIDIKQQRQQHPSRGVRADRVDFAAVARALGCRAWRLEAGAALAPVVAAAFQGEGPALIDVTVDPSGYGVQLAALRG